MGITLEQAVLLETWSRHHNLSGRVTTLGVQHPRFSRASFEMAMGRNIEPTRCVEIGPAANMLPEELFASCGFGRVTAVDISDREGAGIVFDLNSAELPSNLIGSSDLVVNGGTLEHVFHVPNALSNMTKMLAAGGSILHILPCHNCVDHGFYEFGPTLVFDYYAAANFEILESAAVVTSRSDGHCRTARVVPVPEGAFGTGLIGAIRCPAPILYVALVRKTPISRVAPIPMQRLYAQPGRRRVAAPTWFAPFTLRAGERPLVADVREHRLLRFAHAGGFAWTCDLPDIAAEPDSISDPIRSPLFIFEDEQPLGPPHSSHASIVEHGRGAFSHWDRTLMISTSDGSDPRHNGRSYTAKIAILPSSASAAQVPVI